MALKKANSAVGEGRESLLLEENDGKDLHQHGSYGSGSKGSVGPHSSHHITGVKA